MAPIIHAQKLYKRYRYGGGRIEALREITLRVDEGEYVAIMGASGSGKSTLMNLLGLLDQPTAGEYFLDNEDVSHLSVDRQAGLRCRKIGFVFQSYNLLPRQRAVENVELPLIYAGVGATERRRVAVAALADVGLSHRLYHWPDQLSGGEQQRVAIARALVNNPRIILADEPTGALDSATGQQILGLFQLLNNFGHTIVIVTHDPGVARQAKRVVTLSDGKLVSDERIGGGTEEAPGARAPAKVFPRPPDATSDGYSG